MMQIAVIGHGASMEGSGLGPLIDGFETVIRLHDCHWQRADDFGAKYDIGILPGPWIGRAVTQIERTPSRHYLAYSWGRLNGEPPASPATIHLNIAAWRARLIEIGATCRQGEPALTRGLSAIIMAGQQYPGAAITCFGMDNVFSGETENYHYPSYSGASADTGKRHDMDAERRLIPEIASAFNCRIKAHA